MSTATRNRNRPQHDPTRHDHGHASRRRRAMRAAKAAAWRNRWYALPAGTSAQSLAAAGIGNLAGAEPITMGTSAILMAATGWGGVTSARERALYAGIGAGNLAWQGAAALAESGPVESPLPAVLLGGTLAASTAWAWLRVQPLRPPEMAREIRRWEGTDHDQGIFELVGLDGCHLVDAKRVYASKGPAALPIGWDYRIELARGKTTVAAVRRVLPQLENALRVRGGALTVLEDPDRRHQVTIRCIPVRVWSNSAPVNHPLSSVLSDLEDATRRIAEAQAAGSAESLGDARLDDGVAAWMPRQRSVRDPLPLGVYEDGAPATLDMWTPGHGAFHILVGGTSGSGKTNLLNCLLNHLVACDDAQVWGIDIAKSGRNLAPWEQSLTWLADDADGAMALLRAASQAVADRGRAYPIEDSPTLEPTPERPLITVVIDEAAALLSETKNPDAVEAAELVAQIAQQGRELGVQLILITQRPTVESLGGGNAGTILAQLITRLCLKVTKSFEASFVLRDWDQFDPSAFYAKGMVLVQTDEGSDPLPVRIYWSSNPKTVKRVNRLFCPYRPALDGPTERGVLAGAGPAWSQRRGCAGRPYGRARARTNTRVVEHAHASTHAREDNTPTTRKDTPMSDQTQDAPQVTGLTAELAEHMAANPVQVATDEAPALDQSPVDDEDQVPGMDRVKAVMAAAKDMPKSKAARAERTAQARAAMDANSAVLDQYRQRMVEGGPEAGAGISLADLAREHLGDQVPEMPTDELTAQCLDWLDRCGERGESTQIMARKFKVQLREVSDRMTQVARAGDLVERIGHDEKGHAWWRLVDQDAEQTAAEAETAEAAESGEINGDEAAVLDVLAEVGHAGASTSQLAGALGWKSHNVRRRLLSAEAAGRAVRTGERKSTLWFTAENAPTSDDGMPARV